MVGFGAFRLDLDSGELFDGDVRLVLQEQPFRLLELLVRRCGELVRRQELRGALWPDGTSVDGDHGLNTAVKRLRTVLKDSATAPRFIETVPRRGYRFIAALEPPQAATLQPPAPFVGRETELRVLRTRLARAVAGAPHCLCVTGDAGIGKTAFVDGFLTEACHGQPLSLGVGHALERYGAADAYGPVLEALQMLARTHPSLVTHLGRYAPTWVAHLPSLAVQVRPHLSTEVITSTTRARMLREMLTLLAAVAAERPLLLVLEDLHWADESTVELVAALTRRPEPARWLLIGTARPATAVGGPHPIHRVITELRGQGRLTHLELAGVDVAAVQTYLGVRFPQLAAPPGFAQALHDRTDGNPLFVLHCVEALVSDGQIQDDDGTPTVRCDLATVRRLLPSSLADLIRFQLDQLPADQHTLLELAAVVGEQFTPDLLAQITGTARTAVDGVLTHLTRASSFIARVGPRGSNHLTTAGYRFTHAWYSHVLYDSVAPERRAALHGAIAEALEGQFQDGHRRAPADLALHFNRARQPHRAVPYYALAADIALKRAAHTEAAQHVTTGLKLLANQPADQWRDEQNVELLLRLGAAQSGSLGFGDSHVVDTFSRALDLCDRLPDSPNRIPALLGVSRFYGSCGPIGHAITLSTRAVEEARRTNSPGTLLEALHQCAADNFFHSNFSSATALTREALELSKTPALTDRGFLLSGFDCHLLCSGQYGFVQWYLGHPHIAVTVFKEMLAGVREVKHVDTIGIVLAWVAAWESLAGEADDALMHGERAVSLGEEHQDSGIYLPFAKVVVARERCRRGDPEPVLLQMRHGLASVVPCWRPIAYGLLADALGTVGASTEGLALVEQALDESSRTGMCYHDADLLRLRAELSNQAAAARRDLTNQCDTIEATLRRALAVARTQGSRWLELRVAISCGRMSRQDARGLEAAALLADILNSFGAENDCADLREARRLAAAACPA
jgi:DNA-binding winged helix-turn-helix (wHTH) protein